MLATQTRSQSGEMPKIYFWDRIIWKHLRVWKWFTFTVRERNCPTIHRDELWHSNDPTVHHRNAIKRLSHRPRQVRIKVACVKADIMTSWCLAELCCLTELVLLLHQGVHECKMTLCSVFKRWLTKKQPLGKGWQVLVSRFQRFLHPYEKALGHKFTQLLRIQPAAIQVLGSCCS